QAKIVADFNNFTRSKRLESQAAAGELNVGDVMKNKPRSLLISINFTKNKRLESQAAAGELNVDDVMKVLREMRAEQAKIVADFDKRLIMQLLKI
ncbi:hypothetical protein J6590_105563, partial [Homalodisca vitripennis]